MAVVVLLVLLVAVLRLFSGTQRVWSTSGNLSEIYENSRVALEVVTRDLQAAVVQTGETLESSIRFYQPADEELCFVSAGLATGGGGSQLVEVAYKLEDNVFKRAARDDSDAGWNVYGARGHFAEASAYETVVEGVIRQEFVCYHQDGTVWEIPSERSGENLRPTAVSVSLTLLDRQSMRLYQQMPEAARVRLVAQKARTVTKTISL